MNLVDLVILLAFGFAIVDGWRRGAIPLLFDVGSLVISILVAFWLDSVVATFFGSIGLSAGLRPLVAFIVVLLLVDAGLRLALRLTTRLLPQHLDAIPGNQLAGVGLGVAKQAVLTAILVSLLLYLPVVPVVRESIQASKLGPRFASSTPAFERAFATIIEPAVKELQTITTVTQITDEPVKLTTPVGQLVIDPAAEQAMFQLVNKERRALGLGELTWNDELAEVGRIQSKDMWRRQYFSHVNPDGLDPFDRLDAANITYLAAGENLALAPTTPIAHTGLMNSPGHRANILSPEYGEIGIGAIRNGLYGIMYTQLFRD